ncbi:TetR family transcriptional regulator [Actinosynnema sp. NPDC047251]|uniref:TetR/AcrR family transcriptional regulator n=1 Tax=Saccharothrix espanaensis TaxID=103731 RepID=UPI00030F3BF8|nr:TetR family transcriptional regulator [Saccharothrix espanaensis]
MALSRAAVTLAHERGYDHVTVEDISAAAGVSPRTFFNYFAGKEDAVVAPDPEAGDRLRRRVLEQPAALGPGAALKAALLAEIAEGLADEGDMWVLRMRVVQQHPVLLAKVFASGEVAERNLAAAVAERAGQAATDLYPMVLVAAAGAACRVAFARWIDPDDGRPLELLLGEALELLFAGLATPTGP